MTWIGGLLGGLAAITGASIGVFRYLDERRPVVEEYYYRIEPVAVNELERVADEAFAELGASVRFVDNSCLREARHRSRADVVELGGESLVAAYFLGLKNNSGIPISRLVLQNQNAVTITLRNIPSATGVLLCYTLDLRSDSHSGMRFLQASYESAGKEGEIELDPPDENTIWTIAADQGGIAQAAPPRY